MFDLAHCLAIIAVAVWAVLPILIKHFAFESNIAFFLVLRFMVSSVLLSLILGGILRKIKTFYPIEWLFFLLLNGFIYFLQTFALQALPATIYIVVFSLTPILCLFTMRIRLNKNAWLYIVVTLASCTWFALSGQKDDVGNIGWLSVFSMLCGMVGWAIYSAFINRFQSSFNDIEIAGLSSISGLLAALPLWAFSSFSTAGMNSQNIAGTVLIGLIVPIGYFAYSYAIRKATVFAVTSQYFEPIIALAITVVFTAETINLQQAVAAFICIAAAIQAERTGKQRGTLTRS
jgi:drug/metabolite transporter (DMT)-like permease